MTTSPLASMFSASPLSLVAVEDEFAETASCGRVVYWSTSTAFRGELAEALSRAGVPWALPERSAEALMAHVLQAYVAGRENVFLKKIPTGWALCRALPDDGAILRFDVLARVSLIDGAPIVEPQPVMGEPQELIDALQANFRAERRLLRGGDIGAWLVDCIMRMDGVALRDRGSVYFVPAVHAVRLDALARALGAHGTTVFQLPAMRSSDAASAVLAAIEAESQAAVDEVVAFASKDDPKNHTRAAEHRDAILDAAGAKLGRYEAMFGRVLSPIRARIIACRARLNGAPAVLPTCTHDDCWLEWTGDLGVACKRGA
jgi:hypothetical protein